VKTITKSHHCIACRECCKFLKDEIDFAPLFTSDEIKKIEYKINKDNFSKFFQQHNNSKNVFQIKLIKSKKDKKFYVCPFLNEKNHFCGIYKNVPFDCKIWPFMLTKSKDKKNIHLVCFEKCYCPSIKKIKDKEFEDYKKYIINLLKSKKYIAMIKKFPDLVWNEEEDFFFIRDMKEMKV